MRMVIFFKCLSEVLSTLCVYTLKAQAESHQARDDSRSRTGKATAGVVLWSDYAPIRHELLHLSVYFLSLVSNKP